MKTSRREFITTIGRCMQVSAGILPLAGLLSGCKTLETVSTIGAQVGSATGVLTASQAQSIEKSGKAVARSFEDITPEQEYYIGRTVGAQILKKYSTYPNQRATDYINLIGQSLARASDLPETFGGYHFMIQDSDEINALAAPGGLVFVTRGILRCCRSEDAVAAVLAHEIGHVQHRHGLQAIKKSRVTTALTTLGIEGTKTFGGQELSELTETFEQSISDITLTLINNGYSRAFERQADKDAVTITQRLGYDPNGLVDMLKEMEKQLKPGRIDFVKTHPSPASRIADISSTLNAPKWIPEARQRRFQQALAGV
ncbi:MAG: M48 family metalloprotease [Desulfobacteraceae bacterium]|jgi:predicted Zn-dependent protease|nr:M48 family metalloprotease [Desulfobacteraceae bacterium]